MNNGFCNISIKEKKYKKSGGKSLTNLGIHLLRDHKQEYSLADKSRKNDNELLIGKTGSTLSSQLNDFLKSNNLKARNSETVRAYQVVFSIPKECFGNTQLIDKWKKSVVDFVNTNPVFKDNCLMMVYHGDESQPHCQGVFVPKHNGKLNFKELLGGSNGPQKLHKLHDDFAAAMAPLGFSRGDGTHTTGLSHKQYLKSIVELNKPAPATTPLEAVPEAGLFNKGSVIDAQANNLDILKKEVKKLRVEAKKNNFYRTQNEKLKEANNELKKYKRQKETDKMKLENEKLQNLREIDCNEVLTHLGFDPKKEGTTTRTKDNDFNIVVNSENKFTENKSMVQGYGAIDLLCKVFKYSFKESIEFLSGTFGWEKTAKVALSKKEHTEKIVASSVKKVNTALPAPKPNNLPNIVDYLVNKRKINKELVQEIISKNLLYADAKNNCVFTNANKTFAFIRGTFEAKRFVGVKGEIDFLQYDFGNKDNQNVYLFESAIDALSYRSTNPTKNGLYVVLNGSALINKASALADKFKNAICCFDNDEQGQRFVERIRENTIANVLVEVPTLKDFNEDLIAGQAQTTTTSKKLRVS